MRLFDGVLVNRIDGLFLTVQFLYQKLKRMEQIILQCLLNHKNGLIHSDIRIMKTYSFSFESVLGNKLRKYIMSQHKEFSL